MKTKLLHTEAHFVKVKTVRSNRIIGCIVFLRVENLTVSHSIGHHNIGCRMGLREHIFNFFTGINVPLGHPVLQHMLAPLIL